MDAGSIWQLFADGGALGVCAVFIAYLVLQNRELGKRNRELATEQREADQRNHERELKGFEVMSGVQRAVERLADTIRSV